MDLAAISIQCFWSEINKTDRQTVLIGTRTHSRLTASCSSRSCIFDRVGDWLHPCVFPPAIGNASVSPYAVSYFPVAPSYIALTASVTWHQRGENSGVKDEKEQGSARSPLV